ncbi:MAG: nitrite reductase [Hyphomicrobiaceae bacterium]|nr:nitrite reductase [Hyphomicrobiaceae bacterium]
MKPGMSFALRAFLLAALSVLLTVRAVANNDDTETLYKEHCASCHGADRLGGQGPALLPQNLKRLRKKKALRVIASGRAATQMPAFKETLNKDQIAALAEYVYTPLDHVPAWGAAQITGSHVVHKQELVEGNAKTAEPVYGADPLNVFLVVEAGDHHVTVLDGDNFEPIHRFKSRFALHGGPKYSSDGRFVYFASRDGWISKFDMYRLETVAEVRAGINTRNAAVSSDDRYVIVGNYLPHTLVILKASDLRLLKIIPVKDGEGNTSRVSAVYNAPPRSSFIAALKDIPEVWEISYDDDPPTGFSQPWVHDYRKDSGDAPKTEAFPVRRIKVKQHLDDFFFDQDYINLIGASRDGHAQVINLDARRAVADLDLQGMPHLGSGITWRSGETTVLATPNLKKGEITIIDTATWKTIKRLKTLGPGFFMRSHENSPYAWVDVFFGPNRDAMHVIDKETLEIVKTLRPEPGKTAAHVEFDRSGAHALVSIWDKKGALVVYDAKTLKEVKRLPMSKPSGKYNVYNKITYSAGTSH